MTDGTVDGQFELGTVFTLEDWMREGVWRHWPEELVMAPKVVTVGAGLKSDWRILHTPGSLPPRFFLSFSFPAFGLNLARMCACSVIHL